MFIVLIDKVLRGVHGVALQRVLRQVRVGRRDDPEVWEWLRHSYLPGTNIQGFQNFKNNSKRLSDDNEVKQVQAGAYRETERVGARLFNY